MFHLLQQNEPETPVAYAEAVSRLASVRHALRLVNGGFSGGPEPEVDGDIAAAWESACEAKQRSFDRLFFQVVATAEIDIEALLSQRHEGREPHAAASQVLVDEIRRELSDVAQIILR